MHWKSVNAVYNCRRTRAFVNIIQTVYLYMYVLYIMCASSSAGIALNNKQIITILEQTHNFSLISCHSDLSINYLCVFF